MSLSSYQMQKSQLKNDYRKFFLLALLEVVWSLNLIKIINIFGILCFQYRCIAD